MSATELSLLDVTRFAYGLVTRGRDPSSLSREEKEFVEICRSSLEARLEEPFADAEARWLVDQLDIPDDGWVRIAGGDKFKLEPEEIRHEVRLLLREWALDQAYELEHQAQSHADICTHYYGPLMFVCMASATATLSYYLASKMTAPGWVLVLIVIMVMLSVVTILERRDLSSLERDLRLRVSLLKRLAESLFLKA